MSSKHDSEATVAVNIEELRNSKDAVSFLLSVFFFSSHVFRSLLFFCRALLAHGPLLPLAAPLLRVGS